MLGIKNKYGKNAVLKASSYEEGATMRQRNAQIGGHSAEGCLLYTSDVYKRQVWRRGEHTFHLCAVFVSGAFQR